MASAKTEERSPFDVEDDLALGEMLHRELVREFGLETERWALEQARRVERQLQVRRAPRARLTPEVLWLSQMTAFTAPGRYIYVTRELLQRCATDDPLAFVLAHEMAHHDLGHLDFFRGCMGRLRMVPGGKGAAIVLHLGHRLLVGPERELAADAYALDLCLDADYDGRRCLELFDLLEAFALDRGAIDAVFGPDEDHAVTTVGRLLAEAKDWTWRHARGYPPLRERKERLLSRLTS